MLFLLEIRITANHSGRVLVNLGSLRAYLEPRVAAL
jgi:hypothetical protein